MAVPTHPGDRWHNSKTSTGTNVAAGKVLTADGSGAVTWDDAGGGLGWFNVMDYGAANDNTTDDRTDINSAIAALNAAGRGVLYFPAGTGYYVSDSLTTITVPCLILGDGSGSVGESASMIRTDHASAFLFTLNNHNIRLSGLRLYNSNGSETDGAAFRTTTGFGNHNRYDHLWIEGFRDGFNHRFGGEWSMSDCQVTNPVRYGANIANEDIPDGGDWNMSDVWFGTRSRDATDAIHIDSAGGGKLVNVKINCNTLADQGSFGGVKRYVDGIHWNVNGTANTTAVFTVVGCSIENVSGDAIDISTTGTGIVGLIAISGCEIALYTNNTGRAVKLTAASAGGIGTNGGIGVVVLDGLVLRTNGTARAAIELTNTDKVTIGDLSLEGFNARYTSSGDTNTTDGAAVTFATPSITLGGTAAAGAATTVIRSDATIDAFDATAPVTQAFGDVAATGSVDFAARRDHRHGMPAASGVGEILISDTPSTPLVFADLIQNEAQDDLVYADP